MLPCNRRFCKKNTYVNSRTPFPRCINSGNFIIINVNLARIPFSLHNSNSMSDHKVIFLFLTHPSHCSDVLRSKLLTSLADDFVVVVFTPTLDENRANAEGYPQGENIIYKRRSVSHPKFWMIFDKYLRIPFVREFDHLSYVRWFYKRPHSSLRKFLMNIGALLPRRIARSAAFTWLERIIMPISKEFLHHVCMYKPSIVVTATPGFTIFEAEAITFAKKLGIITVAINLNYDNLSSNLKMIRKTDYLVVWNSRMKEEALTLHSYNNRNVIVAGCLRFDHYFEDDDAKMTKEEFLESKSLDPKKKMLLFTSPTPSNYPMRQLLMKHLIQLINGRFKDSLSLLVRIHPIDTMESYKEFVHVPNVCIERAGQSVVPTDVALGQKIEMNIGARRNLKKSLQCADVVVNFASTMIIEASIFDKPVINISFPPERAIVYDYEYNKALVESGAVRMAYTPEELGDAIGDYLAHPERDSEKRQTMIRSYVPFNDGMNWRRIHDFLAKLLEK